MIAKGTTHDSGGRLARYMVTGKKGEYAELYELRGFASPDIVDAFRSVHVIAEATKCQEPFFHVQVRNPDQDRLNRHQWQYTADRIERILGLMDQPRAISFHMDERTGEEHMHVAWSRIDDQTLTAKALPFYKERLKKVSRELELHFGLTLVPNERDSAIKYAPTRAEDEQARRLGFDVHEVRETIRYCFEHSDSGRSLEAALAEEGMIPAKGERRDFVIIDQAGGLHGLGKRILDVSAARVRYRLSDLDREHLPSVEQAREFVRERRADRQQEKDEPVWDRDRDEVAWQTAMIDAALLRKTPPVPEHFEIERQAFIELSGIGLPKDDRPLLAPAELLNRIDHAIWKACERSNSPKAFTEALVDEKVAIAVVTREEADRSHREAAFARALGRYSPRYREGEIVAVTEPGRLYRTSNGEIVEPRRIHRLHPLCADRYLAKLGIEVAKLEGIDTTKEALDKRAEERAAFWEAVRFKNATTIHRDAHEENAARALVEVSERAGLKLGKAAEIIANVADEAIELLGDIVGATAVTPERIDAAIDARRTRTAQSEIDTARFRSDADYRRQVEAAEAARIEQEQQRSRYERERDERQR